MRIGPTIRVGGQHRASTPPSFLRGWWGGRVVLLGCLFMIAMVGNVSAQTVDREYTIKAAYLYKFATYCQWPESALEGPTSPIVFGVLGPDVVGSGLRKIAKAKKIRGRPIVVKHFDKVEAIEPCHILFITRLVNSDDWAAALKKTRGQNTLTVGEVPGFVKSGGVIVFRTSDNRIRITISKSAYGREKLKLSSQLLRQVELAD